MHWLPLPFPRCPGCARTWVTCGHRDCFLSGELEVEPWNETVRCASCNETWSLWNTIFHCSCGHNFDAPAVAEALRQLVETTRRIYEVFLGQEAEMKSIRQYSEASLNGWLQSLAHKVGGLAGLVIGRLARLFLGS